MGEPAYKQRYTWKDYQELEDYKRVEIIAGEMYDMSAAPTTRHQHIVVELTRQMANFFVGKPCKPFAGPMDVKLSDEDVVQPDLLVVCDKDQINTSHINGAPALVVEVMSPATALHDRKRKMALYARAGVVEVWLVDPLSCSMELFVLDGGSYRLKQVYSADETLASPGFDGLEIDLAPVFDFPFGFDETVRVIKEDEVEYMEKGDAR